MKSTYLLLCILFSLTACSSVSEQKVSQSQTDGHRFLESGIRKYRNGMSDAAVLDAQRAYEQFTLSDDEDGKALAQLAQIKYVFYSKDSDQTETLLSDFNYRVKMTDEIQELFTILMIEIDYESGRDYDVIQKYSQVPLSNEINSFVRTAYIAMSKFNLKQSYATELGILTKGIKNVLTEKVEKLVDDFPTQLESIAFINFSTAFLSYHSGNYQESKRYYLSAYSIDKYNEYPAGIAQDLNGLGNCEEKLGNKISAKSYYLRSSDIYGVLKEAQMSERLLIHALMMESDKPEIIKQLQWISNHTTFEDNRQLIKNWKP